MSRYSCSIPHSSLLVKAHYSLFHGNTNQADPCIHQTTLALSRQLCLSPRAITLSCHVSSAEARTSTAPHPRGKPCQRKTRGAASGFFPLPAAPGRTKIFTYQSNQLMELDKVALSNPISAHANQILLSNRCSSPTPL